MTNPKILVTGASGYIGQRVSLALHSIGWDVVCLRNKRAVTKELQSIRIDWRNKEQVRSLFSTVDTIVHIAASAHGNKSGLKESFDPDYILAEHLCVAAVEHNVDKFVYISSISVYGGSKDISIDSESAIAPSDQYGCSKARCEHLLLSELSNTVKTLTFLRLPMVYGKEAPGNPSKLISLILKNIPIPLGCFDSHVRSFANIDLVVEKIVSCVVLNTEGTMSIMVIADEEDMTVVDLVLKLGKMYEKKVRIFNVPTKILTALSTLVGKRHMLEVLNREIVISKEIKNRCIVFSTSEYLLKYEQALSCSTD